MVNITQVGDFEKAPYEYTLMSVGDVERFVKKNVGLGKIKV